MRLSGKTKYGRYVEMIDAGSTITHLNLKIVIQGRPQPSQNTLEKMFTDIVATIDDADETGQEELREIANVTIGYYLSDLKRETRELLKQHDIVYMGELLTSREAQLRTLEGLNKEITDEIKVALAKRQNLSLEMVLNWTRPDTARST